jgi:hypothetical protein
MSLQSKEKKYPVVSYDNKEKTKRASNYILESSSIKVSLSNTKKSRPVFVSHWFIVLDSLITILFKTILFITPTL